MKKILSTLSVVILLSACADMSPPEQAVPDLTFSQVQMLPLNVAKIEIIDDYTSPQKDPYVEHLFATTPEQAVYSLLQKQLVASGTENTLRIHIEEASVVKKPLPMAGGVQGFFNKEAEAVYKGHIALRAEMVSEAAPDIVKGHAEVSVDRSKTLLEGASLAERDRAFFDLTEGMMNDLSKSVKESIGGTFGLR